MLSACTSGEPVRFSPIASSQVFKVAAAPSTVYSHIYGRMDACRVVHNIFEPGDIVGGMNPDRQHGSIYFARDGLALWGAELAAIPEGTKVTTRLGIDARSDRYHSLLRSWAEARPSPPAGTTDC